MVHPLCLHGSDVWWGCFKPMTSGDGPGIQARAAGMACYARVPFGGTSVHGMLDAHLGQKR